MADDPFAQTVSSGAMDPLGQTAVPADGSASETTRAKGERVGRYVIVDVLGRGGMGVVHTAYDPELDRKIALKVVRPELAASALFREHLQREARTMAKLSHPGIVPVHDVGRDGDVVFLSMELVPGGNARVFAETHGWRDIVRVYLDAGRGLAAAHAAGIVHLDVKPENILVGGDRRARIGDFGLARLEGEASDGGTPAYMSPEQHRREATDARSDQFSFAVALWEAVYRRRPFEGASLGAIRDAVCAGRIVAPPPGAPRWLRPILARALRVEPGARWPSIDAMLDAIERGLGRERRRAIGGAIGLVGLAAVASIGYLIASGRGQRLASAMPDPCAHAGDAIDGPSELGDYLTELRALRIQACRAPQSELRRCVDTAVDTLAEVNAALAAPRPATIAVVPLDRCRAGLAADPTFTSVSQWSTLARTGATPSPDGRRVALSDTLPVSVAIAAADGATQLVIPGARDLRWLDNDRVLLAAEHGYEIRSLRDGSIEPAEVDWPAVPDPTGSRVVGAVDGHLVVERLDQGPVTRLALDLPITLSAVAWSPDGRRIAVCGGDATPMRRVDILDASTGAKLFELDGLTGDHFGELSCAWRSSTELLLGTACDGESTSSIIGLRIDGQGAQDGPLLRVAKERDVSLAVMGVSAGGTLVAELRDFEQGEIVSDGSPRPVPLYGKGAGREITGTDAAGRRVLVIGPNGNGWLDPETDSWTPVVGEGVAVPAGVATRFIAVRANDASILQLTATGLEDWWHGALAIGRPVAYACDAERCAIVGTIGSEARVALIDGTGVRTFSHEANDTVRNVVFTLDGKGLDVAIQPSVYELDLRRGTWRELARPKGCHVQHIARGKGARSLYMTGWCDSSSGFIVARLDQLDPRLRVVDGWPASLAVLASGVFAIVRSTQTTLGWLDLDREP